MDDFVRSIFEAAIIREQAARRLYIKLAKKASSKAVKDIFEKLAQEEELHEMLFSKMDVSAVKIVNNAPLKELRFFIEVDKESISGKEIGDVNETLDFAINEEDKAYKDYNLMIKYLDFGPEREAMKAVAGQELKHKAVLEKLKLDFNQDKWRI